MSPSGSGVLARDRANAPRLCLPLRVPLDTSGLQAMRLKRLVGRLCQTPGLPRHSPKGDAGPLGCRNAGLIPFPRPCSSFLEYRGVGQDV
jgi:hypothetical protein